MYVYMYTLHVLNKTALRKNRSTVLCNFIISFCHKDLPMFSELVTKMIQLKNNTILSFFWKGLTCLKAKS